MSDTHKVMFLLVAMFIASPCMAVYCRRQRRPNSRFMSNVFAALSAAALLLLVVTIAFGHTYTSNGMGLLIVGFIVALIGVLGFSGRTLTARWLVLIGCAFMLWSPLG